MIRRRACAACPGSLDRMTQEQTATAVTRDGNEPLALQRHYIDGAFRASRAGGTFESRSPATNEVIAWSADGQAADVDDAVAAARRAFDEGPWPRLPATERAGGAAPHRRI